MLIHKKVKKNKSVMRKIGSGEIGDVLRAVAATGEHTLQQKK